MSSNVILEVPHLLAAARQATGLTRLDGPDLMEPLERLTRALNTEANLTAAGRQMWAERLHGILVTRLRACDWFERHPEILEEQLPPPVVILGLGRTGTTLLQRLLAADERFYAAAWWECRFPVPAPDDIQGEQRIAMAKAEVAAILEYRPELAAIHPWDALAADEDILLLDQTLLSTTAECLAFIPSYREWLIQQDITPAYQYLERFLKFIQWQKRQRGLSGCRWVLKTPMHLGYIDHLLKVWPEATFVQTHRDPLATIPSFTSFVYSLWAGVSDTADPREAGYQISGYFERMLNRCLIVREGLAAHTFVDVDFRDTVSQPMSVIERIYQAIDLPLTALARTQIMGYLATHPREGRPTHQYTLEQFGLTSSDLEHRFAQYRARHVSALHDLSLE